MSAKSRGCALGVRRCPSGFWPTRELLDTLRMVAYRAETALPSPVAAALGKQRETARSALRALFRTDANLRPDAARETPTVQFLRLADPAHDRAVEPLYE